MKTINKLVAVVSVLAMQYASAQSVLDTITLAWNPSPTAGIQKYSLYFSQSTNAWTHVKETGLTLQATVGLPTLGRWFFIATATDTNGLESLPSNILTYEVKADPQKPDGLKILSVVSTRIETVIKAPNIVVIP